MYCKLGDFLPHFLCALLLLNASVAMAQLKEGMPAPAIRAALLDGTVFDSAQHPGKVIVLNFWASWCKPCREEMPALDAYYRAHRAEGLELIAVSIEDAADLVKIRHAMKDFSFPAALAANARTDGYGRVSRLPLTFVIDRRGVLRLDGFKLAKAMDLPTLEKLVTPLLRGSKETVHALASQPHGDDTARHGG